MQLSFDARRPARGARRGATRPVPAGEAARALFALASAPTAIAGALLDDVVSRRCAARLARRRGRARRPGRRRSRRSRTPSFVVFDLETTGSRPRARGSSRSAPSGSRRSSPDATFETLVNPGVPLPTAITALTGIGPGDVRDAPGRRSRRASLPLVRGRAVLVAHNARFDMGFLDRARRAAHGQARGAPVVDTVWLARRLLPAGRGGSASLTLAHFFGTSVAAVSPGARRRRRDGGDPHRADRARAGARSRDGRRPRRALGAARATPARQALARRRGADDARHVRLPRRPRAGALRRTGAQPQRPAALVLLRRAAAARRRGRLGALAASSGSPCGSELEAALDELRAAARARPPANARGTRPDRHVYLRRRGARWVCGPSRRRTGRSAGRGLARRAAQALDGFEGDDPGRCAARRFALRLRRLADDLRFEDAARLRDRIAALEQVVEPHRRARPPAVVARLSRSCLRVEPGMVRAIFVAAVRSRRRAPSPAAADALEVEAGLAAPRGSTVIARRGATRRRAPPARDLPAAAAARAAGDPARCGRDPRGRERGSLGRVTTGPFRATPRAF